MNTLIRSLSCAIAILMMLVGCSNDPPTDSPLVVIHCAGGAHKTTLAESGTTTADATPEAETRQITMNGYGKVFYDADVCDLQFNVVTIADDDLSASIERHQAKTAEISRFMMQYGGPETICAARATVLRRQERRVGSSNVEEFRYVTEFAARFNIFEDVGIVQKELVTRGVNEIRSMELRSSRYNELLRMARDLGVEDARAKVAYIGEVTGWEIAEVSKLVLIDGLRPQSYGSRAMHMDSANSALETFLDANVQVTFTMRRK